ncbi:MAG: hypothetical protein WC322_02205 [Candidatus Paceibacterota bacterium]|jgi:hypothetical protein
MNNEKSAATYKTKPNILAYLKESGWRVSKTTLHRHCTEGKLLPDKITGEYKQNAVDRYARTFLKRIDTGKRVSEEADKLQSRKAKLEIEKLEEEIHRTRYKREIEEGKYIPRDLFELELSGRAAVLDAGLTHMIQSKAGGWIALAGGDDRRTPDLIRAMLADKDALINEYAKNREYTVEFEADDITDESEARDNE